MIVQSDSMLYLLTFLIKNFIAIFNILQYSVYLYIYSLSVTLSEYKVTEVRDFISFVHCGENNVWNT